jgi:hypothetical protein
MSAKAVLAERRDRMMTIGFQSNAEGRIKQREQRKRCALNSIEFLQIMLSRRATNLGQNM